MSKQTASEEKPETLAEKYGEVPDVPPVGGGLHIPELSDEDWAALAVLDEREDATGETKPRFEITDAGGANWYLKRLRNLENEKATVQAQTQAMLKALDADIERLNFLYNGQFQAWVRAELARRGGKSKTLPLHQGTAGFRTVPASLRVLSPREAMEYAQSQGWDVIRRVESLDGEGYKKQAAAVRDETGELIPGVEVVEARENFTIRFATAKDNRADRTEDNRTEGETDS